MPKPRIRKPRSIVYRRATDHRALVLNVVATIPTAATRHAVQNEVVREAAKVASEFHANAVSAMVSELTREGLLGTRDDGTLFVTQYGLDWLENADFTRALPGPYTKPGRKKRS